LALEPVETVSSPRWVVLRAITFSLITPHICSGLGMERVNLIIRHWFKPAKFIGWLIFFRPMTLAGFYRKLNIDRS